jgi:hypothetical protein
LVALENNLDARVGGDPSTVGSSLGVYTGVAGESAAIAPGDDSVEVAVEEEGTARVTLARVDTTLIETGADLVGGHTTETAVSRVACGSIVNGDDNLQEDVGGRASSRGGTPSRDLSGGANGAGCALSQKTDCGGVSVPGEGITQLNGQRKHAIL